MIFLLISMHFIHLFSILLPVCFNKFSVQGPPIGNDTWAIKWPRDWWHYVTPKVLWGSTSVGNPSDSLASCSNIYRIKIALVHGGADAEQTEFAVFNNCRYSLFFGERNTDVETSVSVLVEISDIGSVFAVYRSVHIIIIKIKLSLWSLYAAYYI